MKGSPTTAQIVQENTKIIKYVLLTYEIDTTHPFIGNARAAQQPDLSENDAGPSA